MLDLLLQVCGEVGLIVAPLLARRWPRPVGWAAGGFAGVLIAGGLVWLLPPAYQTETLYRGAYPGDPLAYLYAVWLLMVGAGALGGAAVADWIAREPPRGAARGFVSFRGTDQPALVFASRSRALRVTPYAAATIAVLAAAESVAGRTAIDRRVGLDVAVGALGLCFLASLFLWRLPRIGLAHSGLHLATPLGTTRIAWPTVTSVSERRIRGIRLLVLRSAAAPEVDGPTWRTRLARADRVVLLPLACWRGGGELFEVTRACAVGAEERARLLGPA